MVRVANAEQGRRELCVSLFQAVVLFQFNDAEQLLYTDIRDRTNIGTSGCFYAE